MAAQLVTSTGTESRALVERAVGALGQGDLETLASCVADNVTWELVGQDYFPGGPVFAGKEACVRELAPAAAAVYDLSTFSLTPRSVIAEGDTVAVEFGLTATTARGRSYSNSYCLVFTVAEGLIRSVREYTDTRYAHRILFG